MSIFGKRKSQDHFWKPNNGDTYYWVRSDIGMICKSEWASGTPRHEFRWSIGNVFKSRSEAQRAITTQKQWFKDKLGGK